MSDNWGDAPADEGIEAQPFELDEGDEPDPRDVPDDAELPGALPLLETSDDALRTLIQTGGENDSPSRQLARHVKESGERYVKNFKVTVTKENMNRKAMNEQMLHSLSNVASPWTDFYIEPMLEWGIQAQIGSYAYLDMPRQNRKSLKQQNG